MWKTAITLLLISIGLSHYFLYRSEIPVPDLPDTFWGPEKNRGASTEIRPFKIDVPQSVIDDLKQRLASARINVEPLEGAAWTYGITSPSLKKIVEYWRTKYNWTERQALLNKYPQFKTNIQGLDIHFYHVKPTLPKDSKIKVLPLLIVHGWPGSVVEFQQIIPLLTTPRPDKDFVFEVIAPSLPGYGFSDRAVRPGLGPGQIAVIFKNLMSRLGFEKFYTQGGDWGSTVTSNIGILFPEKILGTHLNMCFVLEPFNPWLFIGSFFPSLVVENERESEFYPLKNSFNNIMLETGYMHLQATKPDTIGLALSNSPVSLAAYILEKFSVWTNTKYPLREDGGLTEKFTLDELLDNLMVYWVTDSITSSARLYAEHFSQNYQNLQIEKIPVPTPTGCAIFPNEVLVLPKKLINNKYPNLIHYTYQPRGGHFAAFEEPKLLADDFFAFVDKVETSSKKKEKKETHVPEKVDKKQPKAT